MSWSFRFEGSRADVKTAVDAEKDGGAEDQMQIDRAKALIIHEINDMPDEVTHVKVEAFGHHGGGWRNLALRIDPVTTPTVTTDGGGTDAEPTTDAPPPDDATE